MGLAAMTATHLIDQLEINPERASHQVCLCIRRAVGIDCQDQVCGVSNSGRHCFPNKHVRLYAEERPNDQILFSFSPDKERRTDSRIRRKNTALLSLLGLKEKRI